MSAYICIDGGGIGVSYPGFIEFNGRKCIYKFAFVSNQCSVSANQMVYQRLYRRHFMKFCRYFTCLFFENKAIYFVFVHHVTNIYYILFDNAWIYY